MKKSIRALRFSGVFFFLLFFLALLPAPPASAASGVVRDGRIEETPGFRFQNVRYGWDKVYLDIVNMTDRNAVFGGTMIFLDRRGQPLARARLQSKKIARNSMERYTAYCVAGTGEAARKAARVIWDLGPR